jgi:hypothetical protein
MQELLLLLSRLLVRQSLKASEGFPGSGVGLCWPCCGEQHAGLPHALTVCWG